MSFNLKTTNLNLVRAGAPFTWGRVLTIHDAGPYTIIEAKSNSASDEDRTVFHVYVKGENTSRSSYSFDGALIIAISYHNQEDKKSLSNTDHNARCAAKILNIPSDY